MTCLYDFSHHFPSLWLKESGHFFKLESAGVLPGTVLVANMQNLISAGLFVCLFEEKNNTILRKANQAGQ